MVLIGRGREVLDRGEALVENQLVPIAFRRGATMATANTDPRAWNHDSVDERERWFHTLSVPAVAALRESIRQVRGQSRSLAQLRPDDRLRAALVEALNPVRTALDRGRGFAVIRGVTPEQYSPEEMQAGYWLIGHALGQPVEQNVQGVVLYDVRDTGQDVRAGARFSVTNAESSFHTDNSFGPTIVDYVGLLCRHTAKSGGLSQVVSGYAVHDELRSRHPEVLELLARPWHIDRRGGRRPDEAPTVQYPVLAWDDGVLTYRYLRYWIESGHARAGQPLNTAQRHALDVLDAVLAKPELRVEFALAPGDLFFINNRWILHNRTAFEDHVEPEQRRHLIRLWLEARGGSVTR
jgi:alpha-ketoglutarate-dependent taurine dioxygenase